MSSSIIAVHNRLLKEKIRETVREIQAHAPEIEAEQRTREFVINVNAMKFRERMKLIWRILRRKL